jgi:hypothetical protein
MYSKNYFSTLRIGFVLLATLSGLKLTAQMVVGSDTLYGNEWIRYEQSYVRIAVAADGIYRLNSSQLTASGVPLSTLTAGQFQMFCLGKEVPLYTSTNGSFGSADFIEFSGRRNRTDLEQYLFKNGKADITEPDLSIKNDTLVYYLTWNSTPNHLRYNAQTNNLTGTLPAKEPWFWFNSRVNSRFGIHKSEAVGGQSVYVPDYRNAEGFGSESLPDNTFTLNAPFFELGQNAVLTVQGATARLHAAGSSHARYLQLSLGTTPFHRDTFYRQDTLFNKEFELQPSQIAASMRLRMQGTYAQTDRFSLGYANLRYARKFNFGGQKFFQFQMPASTNLRYLEIENFDATSTNPILYDLINNWRLVATLENGKIRIALPPSALGHDLVLVNSNTPAALEVKPMRFDKSVIDNVGSYLLISSQRLLSAAGNPVGAYAAYRASSEGGSYRTAIVEHEQLTEQFAYGATRNPLAIRNFLHFTNKNWRTVKAVLLVGKSREYKETRDGTSNKVYDFPSWGSPGADILLGSKLGSTVPVYPIGRVSAIDPQDIFTYLGKVKEYELVQKTAPQTIESRAWLNNILHLSGGSATDAASLQVGINTLADTLNKPSSLFTPKITSFYKISTDPIQTSAVEAVYDRLNKGVSMVTFFGHSAPSSLDISVDNPNYLANAGRYPVFMALGCSAGNVHQASYGVSENMNFYRNKGTSAFIGTSGSSYIWTLNLFAGKYYSHLSTDMYGKSIGDIIVRSIADLDNNKDEQLQSTLQEVTIHGDPVIRVNYAETPDYISDYTSVKLEPANLVAQLDSFTVVFDVFNLGRSSRDSMTVEFKQKLPNNSEVVLKRIRIESPRYKSTYRTKLPMLGNTSVGANKLYITLDADNEIVETPAPSAESNNALARNNGELGYNFFVLSNTATVAYPPRYAIVPLSNITLKASTTNALAQEQTYILELDTLATFNSSFKKRTTIRQSGGILKWTPTVAWQENKVYYWRVSPDSLSPISGFAWSDGSFVHLKNTEGWSQSHFQQFKENKFTTYQIDDDQQFRFSLDIKVVDFRNNFAPNGADGQHPAFRVNGNRDDGGLYQGFPNAGLYVSVFDSATSKLWRVKSTPHNSLKHPRNFDVGTFAFDATNTDPDSGRIGFINFLNSIPDNNTVIVFTVQKRDTSNYRPQDWAADSVRFGTNIFKELERHGATRVRDLAVLGTRPYLFVFKKGTPGVISEGIGDSFRMGIQDTFSIEGRWHKGSMNSGLVGPSKAWERLDLKYEKTPSRPELDSVSFNVYGVAPDRVREELLLENVSATSTSLASIDANTYPYLRLRYFAYDSLARSSSQLVHWRVISKTVPDFAVNPNAKFQISKDTVQQGEMLGIEVAVENISETDADSVLVQLSLSDVNNSELKMSKKFPPLEKNKSFNARFDVADTKSIAEGKSQILLEVNPNMNQPELFQYNNYLSTAVGIRADKRDPLLDVTFDGIHIMNNDIVSAKPQIVIELRDENPFLSLSDTSTFTVFVQKTPSGARTPVYLNSAAVRFVPAKAGQSNRARIEYSPEFTTDGTYRLIIESRDASGNTPSGQEYAINFKIITKQMLANVLPYPNPFSSATRFVYTLTGAEPPRYFKIQILSVAGKVVREITQDEIGRLRIGTHLTDYVWDGTDTFGNKLANGVYLYRIVAKDGLGKALDKYATDEIDTDRYFEGGFGKLVIVR